MKEQVDKQRTEWLRLAKRIATHLLERWELVENDLSPSNRQRTNERQAALKAICKLNREINGLADEMAAIEQTARVGTRTLLRRTPTHLMRIVVSLMATARFDPVVERQTRCVGDIVGVAGATDPEDCLAVRAMFRDDSPLRPHLSISYKETLDSSFAVLKEVSLNRLLAQRPDSSAQVTEAIAITHRWK